MSTPFISDFVNLVRLLPLDINISQISLKLGGTLSSKFQQLLLINFLAKLVKEEAISAFFLCNICGILILQITMRTTVVEALNHSVLKVHLINTMNKKLYLQIIQYRVNKRASLNHITMNQI